MQPAGMNVAIIADAYVGDVDANGCATTIKVILQYNAKQPEVIFFPDPPLPAGTDLRIWAQEAIYELAISAVPVAS
jgi:hypothetical protein